MIPQPRWKIEIKECTFPVEKWEVLRYESGKRYVFVDREQAEAILEKLVKVQPHLRAPDRGPAKDGQLRIAPM